MKKLFFVFAFVFAFTFVNANNFNKGVLDETTQITKIDQNFNINLRILSLADDHCTVTVSIYENGELVSSATWTDNTGDCRAARAGATMMAYSLIE